MLYIIMGNKVQLHKLKKNQYNFSFQPQNYICSKIEDNDRLICLNKICSRTRKVLNKSNTSCFLLPTHYLLKHVVA